MRYKLIISLVLSSLVFDNVSAFENSTLYYLSKGIKKPLPTGELNSLNWTIIKYNESKHRVEDECAPSNEFYPLFDPGSHKEQFELSVRVERHESSESKTIVLQVMISNVTFHKLKVVQQDLVKSVLKIYDPIQFERDEEPHKLTMLLLVTDLHRTRLQFFADEIHNGFFKEYYFIPPSAIGIESRNTIAESIFAYVDTTLPDKVWLYVQPLPEKWNITTYVGKLRKLEPKSDILYSFNITGEYLQHVSSNFTDEGSYFFQLTPVDNNGRKYASTNVTGFCRKIHQSLVVMVVSITAVPVVMFFAFYLAYIKYRGRLRKWLETRKPRCLVVYDATRKSHIDFVKKLVEYLRKCQISAIDLFDVPIKTHPNPGSWCDDGFQSANFVIVVPSPESEGPISAYKNLFPRAMKLIDEQRHCKDKSYLIVMPPYCDKSHVPKEAHSLGYLELKTDKDVKKLVNRIHHAEYTEEFKVPDAKELVNSIKSAERNILYGETYSTPESFEQHTDTSSPSSDEVLIDLDADSDEDHPTPTPDDRKIDGRLFSHDIRLINLMGRSMDSEKPEES